MTLPQDSDLGLIERRRRAVARLESTGDIEAVARGFKITPAELAAWAAEASSNAGVLLDDRERDRVAPRSTGRFARRPRPDHPMALPAIIAIGLGCLPLPAWPIMALWAVIGGFIDGRGTFDTAVFGWSLVLYPVVFVPCAIAWAIFRRRMPGLAFGLALVPCLQILVFLASFAYGISQQGARR